MSVKRNTVRIAGEDYPYGIVKSKFLKLNSGYLKYVIRCTYETNRKSGTICMVAGGKKKELCR